MPDFIYVTFKVYSVLPTSALSYAIQKLLASE
jgi:hypothetical protein